MDLEDYCDLYSVVEIEFATFQMFSLQVLYIAGRVY